MFTPVIMNVRCTCCCFLFCLSIVCYKFVRSIVGLVCLCLFSVGIVFSMVICKIENMVVLYDN